MWFRKKKEEKEDNEVVPTRVPNSCEFRKMLAEMDPELYRDLAEYGKIYQEDMIKRISQIFMDFKRKDPKIGEVIAVRSVTYTAGWNYMKFKGWGNHRSWDYWRRLTEEERGGL